MVFHASGGKKKEIQGTVGKCVGRKDSIAHVRGEEGSCLTVSVSHSRKMEIDKTRVSQFPSSWYAFTLRPRPMSPNSFPSRSQYDDRTSSFACKGICLNTAFQSWPNRKRSRETPYAVPPKVEKEYSHTPRVPRERERE